MVACTIRIEVDFSKSLGVDTMKGKLRKKWMKALIAYHSGDRSNAICPLCSSKNLRQAYLFCSKDSDGGHALIWCEDCKRGFFGPRTVTHLVRELKEDDQIVYGLPDGISF